MRIFMASIVAFVVFLAGPSTQASQAPPLSDVLARAAEYHATYTRQSSGVQLEEQMHLTNDSPGRIHANVRLTSHVVLVTVNGQVMALRDPFAVDTRPIREHRSRILELLGAPATPAVRDWERASAWPAEARSYFVIDIVLRVNEPTSALQFIARANQPSLRYRLDGRKTMNGVPVVGVRFEEPSQRDHKYMLYTRSNARASGRFWIDPANGAIHQTELWVDAPAQNPLVEHAIVSVKYAPHAELGLLLPTDMNNSYEEREGRDANNVTAHFLLQSRSTYSNATFAAIDLTRLR